MIALVTSAWPWRRRWASALLAVLVGLGLAGLLAAPAGADEQPSILQTYDLDWIERVPEGAWPQPKEQRPVICLLDTGVAITPDTPADDPAGPIVARLAVDGSGDGLPQGTEPLHNHGTQMAQVIAAPRNDWGTVGVFPQARIVSVRVTHKTETHIAPEEMVKGVAACLNWAWARAIRVAAIVMAESNYDQRAADATAWEVAGQGALRGGSVLLAAGGNAPGAESPVPPFGVPEVTTVGAGTASGAPCSFAPAGVAPTLWGPGCHAAGWPSGSSTATAVAGAAVAAAVTRDPALESREALAQLMNGAVLSGAALRGAEFPEVVAAPAPRVVADGSETLIVREVERVDPRATRAWRPKVAVSWGRGRLRVRVAGGVPASGRVQLQIGSKVLSGPRGARRFTLRLAKRPVRVAVWVEGERPTPWRSLSRRTKVKRT